MKESNPHQITVWDESGDEIVTLVWAATGRYKIMVAVQHRTRQLIGFLVRSDSGSHGGVWCVQSDPWSERRECHGNDMIAVAVEYTRKTIKTTV